MIGKDYIILDNQYKNSKFKMEILCNKCNNKFLKSWEKLRIGQRCPLCKKKELDDNKRLDIEKIKYRLEKVGRKYISGNIKNVHSRVTVLVEECGHIQESNLNSLMRSKSKLCPNCLSNKKLDNILFIERLQELNLEPIENYVNNCTNTKVRCIECKYEWSPRPDNLFQSSGCPVCKKYFSLGESNIIKYLNKNKIAFTKEKVFEDLEYINKLRFDFYIPNNNTIIEFDGKQHFLPSFTNKKEESIKNLELNKFRDSIKNNYCKENNIPLLRINYKDKRKIEKILDEWFNDYPIDCEIQ